MTEKIEGSPNLPTKVVEQAGKSQNISRRSLTPNYDYSIVVSEATPDRVNHG